MIEEVKEGWQRLWIGFVLVVGTTAVGSAGFKLLGHLQGHDWPLTDCMYMTVITLSTVGFNEVLPVHEVPGGRLFTVILIIFGMGMLLYFASAVVALVVEFNIKAVLERRTRLKALRELKGHIIVCGAGTTGIHVIEELQATDTPFVVVETTAERIEWIASHLGTSFLHLIGDATDDTVLLQAGIERAQGVVTTLSSDKDNLFVTITARQLNPNLRIVARSREASATNKMMRAGADSVVSPNLIGGMRMVSEMIRPKVVQFLDLMLRDKDKTLRIEEAIVPQGSAVAGQSLADANLRKITEALVIAARAPDGSYKYHPGPDYVLQPGAVLIVLGEISDVGKLRKHLTL
jgi:voltage-gated potassium channel